MNPSILARVNYRLRTSELVSTDWDEDEVPDTRTASRRRRRSEITDQAILGTRGSPDTLRALVRRVHRDHHDKSERAQDRIFQAVVRRYARLAAAADRAVFAARAALTPKVHAVKSKVATGRKEEA